MINKLNAKKFALAGGTYGAIFFTFATIAGIAKVPGFVELSSLLNSFYGAWGYSVTWTGVIFGAFYGFGEGFIHFGLFAWIYNKYLG